MMGIIRKKIKVAKSRWLYDHIKPHPANIVNPRIDPAGLIIPGIPIFLRKWKSKVYNNDWNKIRIITVNPEIFTILYIFEITAGVVFLTQAIKNTAKVKVHTNDRNVVNAALVFSVHKRLIPAHIINKNAKIKGGEIWREIFFNPPWYKIRKTVKKGNRIEITLFEYAAPTAMKIDTKKSPTFSYDFNLSKTLKTPFI